MPMARIAKNIAKTGTLRKKKLMLLASLSPIAEVPMPATQAKNKATGHLRPGGGAPQVMTAEEYVALPKRKSGYSYELAQNVLVLRDPGVAWVHSSVQGKLYRYLDEWMEKFGHGDVGVEVDCLLSEDPDTIRIPDIAVLLQPFDAENTFHGRVRGAPDIAIEVLSPSNRPQDMRAKTREYFQAGALRVWIVDPATRTIVMHSADGTCVRLKGEDRLEDPEILPGLAIELRKIFGR